MEQAKQRSAEVSPKAASLAVSPLKEHAATLMDVGKQASLSMRGKAPLQSGSPSNQWPACILCHRLGDWDAIQSSQGVPALFAAYEYCRNRSSNHEDIVVNVHEAARDHE